MAKKPLEKTIDKNDPFLTALAECKKEFGDEAIMTFDDTTSRNVEFTPSGSIALDLALGGGFPKGRIVEIYGPESSGKTTCCLHAVAERQKIGGKVVYVDVEHALDPGYMAALGIDLKAMAISQPDCAEQAFDIAEKMIPYSDVVVIDSVAAMVPKAERDGEMSDNNIGLQARIMSKGLRKITPLAHKSNCLVIFVNQIRMKIGVMFGNPETTSGGNALKFYASQRLEVRRTTSPIKEGSGKEEAAVGNATKIKVIKNKVAPPFRVAELDIRYGEGFDKIKEALDFGVLYNIIGKSGAFYSYGDVKLQGAAKARAWLVENPEIREEITAKIFEAIEKNGVIEEEEDTISKLMNGVSEPSILDHVQFDKVTGEIISDDPLDNVK